jgi:hypothetical protein
MGLPVLVLGAVAWHKGVPAWRVWKQQRQLVRAGEFAAQKDNRQALVALQKATEGASGDPRIWREAVQLLTQIGSPEVVGAMQRLVRLEPSDLGLRVALIKAALQFGEAATAASSLDVLEKSGRDDPAFHRLAMAVAVVLGKSDEFERHLVVLVQAEPDNLSARFHLAALRLWSLDEDKSAEARFELVKLTRDPSMRLRAALERLKFAVATREPARLDEEVAALLGEFKPGAGVGLKDGGRRGEPPGWSQLVMVLQEDAAETAGLVALTARWMGGQNLHADALAWLDTLPAEMRMASEVAAAEAVLTAGMDNMSRLEDLLKAGALGAVPTESIFLALAARVQTLRTGETRARATWEDAVAASRESLSGLRVLAELGSIWKDNEGTDAALWELVSRYPGEYWAYEALRVSFSAKNDMDKLWGLYQIWAPRLRDDKKLQQNWIKLGALLNRSDSAQWKRAEEMLREEGPGASRDTLVAAIGARWRAGRLADAQQALELLPKASRKEPEILFWEAILAAARDDQARLDEVMERLLPDALPREERQILAGAVADANRRKRAVERAATKQADQVAGALDIPLDAPAGREAP